MTVTIRNTYTIKAAGTTPSGGGRMYLSEFDQSNAITHAPTIYIYRRPTSAQPFESLVENLANALSRTLQDFYPAAGRLHYIPNGGGRLELECNNKGVTLIEAESELCVEDLGDFSPSPLISSLIPQVDFARQELHEIPLILVQVTKFCCGGISLGLATSHFVMDGQAAMLFVSQWSKYALGVNDPVVRPFLDRTVVKERCALPQKKVDYVSKDYSRPPLMLGRSDDMEERRKESVVATLKLSIKEVEELKYKANLGNKGGRPYSRYEAIAAHMWRCASKARRHDGSQPTRLRVAIDFRNRLKPPLPPAFFGNAVFALAVETTSGELLDNPLGHVSSIIRETVAKVNNDEYIREAFAYVASQPDVTQYRNFHSLGCTMGWFFGNPNFVITSWLSLPLYGTDLGWGPEDYMGPGAIGFDGKCYLMPDRKMDGSVVVIMRLQVEHMDEFKRYFYEDI